MPTENDLATRLLTLAGAIMEDASAVAIMGGDTTLDQRVTVVRQAAYAVHTLADAADVALRYDID